MAQGKVKWFNEKKGYGFIQMDGGGEDAFAHYTNIQGEGFKTLVEGQVVECDVIQDAKGAKAMNIVPAPQAAPVNPSADPTAPD